MIPRPVVTGLCILVAFVWATSIGLSMVNPDYKPDPAINAIFGGVIGTALALGKDTDKGTGAKAKTPRGPRS